MAETVAQRGERSRGSCAESGEVVAVIDGNSLYSRAFFASVSDRNEVENDDLTDISLALLVPIIDPTSDRVGHRFDRLLWCWDTQQKRDKKRGPKPPGFDEGLARFKKAVCQVVGGGQSEVPGYEADDQVATAVYSLLDRDSNATIYVVSSDKDLHQLVGPRVRFYCLSQKAVLSRHSILSRWHVKRPAQVAIAQAILGDRGDNISGIKGWGEKKVQKLFEQVTQDMDLEQALEAVMAQIPPGDKLASFIDSLELTFLNSGVPDVTEPAPLKFSKLSHEQAEELGVVKSMGVLSRLRIAYSGQDNDTSWLEP